MRISPAVLMASIMITSSRIVWGDIPAQYSVSEKEIGTISVILKNTIAVEAGAICLRVDPMIRVKRVSSGSALKNESKIYYNLDYLLVDSVGNAVPGGLLVGWLNSDKRKVTLSPGESEIINIEYEFVGEISATCLPITFTELKI